MKIVMLGGTGYLGSKILSRMEKEGHSLLCITRTPHKYPDRERVRYCGLQGLEQEIQDFKPEIFISTVSRYLKEGTTEKEVIEANFEVPAQVLLACMAVGIKRVIAVGTALPESFNIYSFSKKLFAELGKWYADQDQIEFMNIKLEMFYGKDEPGDRFLSWVVQKMIRNEEIPLTVGTQKRDIIYADDAVDAICSLAGAVMPERYADIPLGTGEAPTIREVIEYLHRITESRSLLLFGAIPMRANEPDTCADKREMDKWKITVKYNWKAGMELFARYIKERQQPD